MKAFNRMNGISQACEKLRESLIEKTYGDHGDGGIRSFFWSVIRSKECESLSDMRDPETDFILVDDPFRTVSKLVNEISWPDVIDKTISQMTSIANKILKEVSTPHPSDRSIARLFLFVFAAKVQGELQQFGKNAENYIEHHEEIIALELLRWRIKSSIQCELPERLQSLNDGRRYIKYLQKYLVDDFDSDISEFRGYLVTMYERLCISATESQRAPRTTDYAWYCAAAYFGVWYTEQLEGFSRRKCDEFSATKTLKCHMVDRPPGYYKSRLYNFVKQWLESNSALSSRVASNNESLDIRLFRQERCFGPSSGQVLKPGSHQSTRHR